MNSVVDNSLVGLALLLSAGYAVLTLGPRGLRRGLLTALRWIAARTPAFLGLRRSAVRLAERLAAAASGKAAGACGGCDDCGSEPKSGKSTDGEVTVPVAKIGRR
ncbi:MAG TPA: DUF6587 family protein [Steroidobacteraceae bacterium]